MPFKYEPRNAAQVEKRANQSAAQYQGIIKDGFNVFGARQNENTIRIMPPTWEKPEHYGYDIFVHYGVGPENATVLCLSKMKHQPCPVCEYRAQLEIQGREEAGDYKPTRRVLVWLLDGKAESDADNPQAWAMPWTFDRDISAICKDRETGELYQIDNPDEGFNIYFDKKGEKELTKYTGHQLAKKPSSVDPKFMSFVEKNPLPTILLWRSYEEVQRLFQGDAPAADIPTSGSSEPKSTKSATFAPAPTLQATAIKMVAPIETKEKELCPKTMKLKGEKMVCSLPSGHDGDCDFAPEVSETQPAFTLVAQEFCSKTQTFKGQKYGCGLIGDGHKGDCDFSREITNGAAPLPAVLAAAAIDKPTTTGTVDRMKQRFQTGPK